MSFSKLSPVFRESLRETIDKMASEKKAQCGCGGASPDGGDKKRSVDELTGILDEVNRRLIVDWLYALDDGSREEVKRLFTELRDLSAAEFVLLMKRTGACCPWQFIGSMFSTEEDDSTKAPNTEIVIVEDSAQGGTAI